MFQRRGAKRAVISIFALFTTSVLAQGCYYPDGITLSNDVPCNPDGSQTSCCASQSFCLNNGLCYGNGLVSRGSCTDKTWSSPSCAGYCRTEHKSESVILTPCSSTGGTNLFACGLNTTRCATNTNTFVVQGGSGLILRPSQVAQLVGPALASASALPTAEKYTITQIIGVAAGVAVPLLIALGITIFFLMREKRRHVSTVSRDLHIRDDKGYRNLQSDASPFSPAGGAVNSTSAFNNPPGYNSPVTSPVERGPMTSPALSHAPVATYMNPLSPPRNGPIDASRPPSSRAGSTRHTIFPQASTNPLVPGQSQAPTAQSLRPTPLNGLTSRESVRSQNTVNSTLSTPTQAHMPGFPDAENSPRATLRVATVQTVRPVNRGPDSRQSPPPSQAATPNLNPQQQQLAVQNYQRDLAYQHAGVIDGYAASNDTTGRAELDSADNRVLRHELGDGRRSWVKQ